jgi:colicin import membrane protein
MAEPDPNPESETVDDAIVASVAASISAIHRPAPEDELDRLLRVLDRQALDARIRERAERERAQHEAEQRAEQARQQQAARAAASRALMEQAARQQRERDARLDGERIAAIENQMTAARARAEQERREQATREHWQFMDDRIAEMNRLVNSPRDPLAEIDALHADLAAREEALEQRMAAEREAQRSAKYYSDQAAAIARRESGKW